MGTGTLATSLNPKKNDYKTGFCFMVSVQDHGEPGAEDTWRIRIWKCEGPGGKLNSDPLDLTMDEFVAQADMETRLVFDTNYVPKSYRYYNEYKFMFPLPSMMEPPDSERYRFNGTNVGELHQNGGGNIQIHLKGKKSEALQFALTQGYSCNCTVSGAGSAALPKKKKCFDS